MQQPQEAMKQSSSGHRATTVTQHGRTAAGSAHLGALAATPSEPLATRSASGLAAAAGTGDSDMMQMMQMMVKESFRQGEKHGQTRQARAAAEHDSREQRRRLSETQHRLKQAQAEAEFLKQQVEQLRGDNLMLQHRQQQQRQQLSSSVGCEQRCRGW